MSSPVIGVDIFPDDPLDLCPYALGVGWCAHHCYGPNTDGPRCEDPARGTWRDARGRLAKRPSLEEMRHFVRQAYPNKIGEVR